MGTRPERGVHAMVTLSDVAALAGVSASTVSYSLSGKRPISDATRNRVMQAAAELGYRPHTGVVAPAPHRSNAIALMVPLRSDMYVPVIMEIVTAVTTAAREHGQDILLLTGDEGTKGVRRVAAGGRADAVILMDVELDDGRVPTPHGASMPAVLVGLTGNTDGLTCVDLDFEAAGAACVDHLADLGHREIALVGESPSVYRRHAGFAARTLAGFRRRARERGLRALYRPCDAGFESVAGALMGILGERPTATGFVVQNENAVGPLPRLLDRHGRAVPDDVSVVAICPDQLARNASPPLTCVPIPAEEMGRTAVELVMARLAGRSTGGATLIRPELVVRDSSRALSRPPGS